MVLSLVPASCAPTVEEEEVVTPQEEEVTAPEEEEVVGVARYTFNTRQLLPEGTLSVNF